MTAQSEKTEQMRLDSCVWAPSKRDKVHETPRQNASETRKNGDFLANTIARVEIIRENSQGHHNMSLLGKYPLNYCILLNLDMIELPFGSSSQMRMP